MRRAALLFAAAVFSLSSVAHATPVTYAFTVNWTSGELKGSSSQGRFTYDLSQLDAFGQAPTLGALDDFEFTLRDLSFTEADVKILFAAFDGDGNLRRIGIGNDCELDESTPPQASCLVMGDRPDNFYIGYFPGRPVFTSGAGGGGAVSSGDTTMQRVFDHPNEVPEPGSIALFGLAGGLLAYQGRRKRK